MNIKRFFSFDWLKSEERKELEQLRRLKLEEEIKKKILVESIFKEPVYLEQKVYKNLYFSGNSITVILNEGEVLSSECDLEKYARIKESKTKEEILSLLYPKENKKEEYVIAKNDLAILEVNSDFEVVGTKVYLKPCKLEIPEIVKATFIEILEKKLAISSAFYPQDLQTTINVSNQLEQLDEQYESLKMFWYKLSTSSVEKCRESVLRFCRDNDVRLSKLGNLITYRCVEVYNYESDDEKTLKEFLNLTKGKLNLNNYYLLKYIGKDVQPLYTYVHKYTNKNKYPKDYVVISKLNNVEIKQKETIYTSQHSYGKYTFKIGDVYKLNDDEQPDDTLDNCSSNGLHSASCHWDYSSFGKVKVVTLINPAKTIFVPSSDTGKFRCSEMKIACLNPNQRGVHIDESLIEQADKEYNDYTIEELQNIVKNKDFSSLSVQENVPLLSLPDLKDIVHVLQNKVVKI